MFFGKETTNVVTNIAVNGESNYGFGIFITFLIIAETLAFFYKKKILANLAYKNGGISKTDNELIMTSWVMHMIVGALIAVAAAKSFGGTDNLIGLFVMAEVIRNLIIFGVLLTDFDGKKSVSPIKQVFSEIIIALFNFIVYVGIWGSITWDMSIDGGNIALTLIYAFCAFIIFMIFYASLNIFPLLEFEIDRQKTFTEKLNSTISFVAVILAALLPLYLR
jgi:hypothetical protein